LYNFTHLRSKAEVGTFGGGTCERHANHPASLGDLWRLARRAPSRFGERPSGTIKSPAPSVMAARAAIRS
jgi:hypothetical protein